jgi:uncharacterized protein (TIGR02147 family)
LQKYSTAYLKAEFERRRARNKAYSMRAFASSLGVGIATLSDVMSGKRGLSPKNRVKISEKLKLSPLDRERFLTKQNQEEELEKLELEDRKFRLISDWYHYAILELTYVKDHKASAAWIAKKIGIAKTTVKDALVRLVELQLLKIEDSCLIQTTPPLKTTDNIPSLAIRKRHQELMDLAKESIEHDPIDQRYFYEITIAVDPARVEEAQMLMRKSIRKIAKKLGTGKPTEIYSLGTQLFPLNGRGKG